MPHTGVVGLNDDYTSGSFRSIIITVIAIVVVIALIWLAYGWATDVAELLRPPGQEAGLSS